jgi:hypothetical protein
MGRAQSFIAKKTLFVIIYVLLQENAFFVIGDVAKYDEGKVTFRIAR